MRIISLLVALMLVGGGAVFADNFFDDATDILKLRNEDFPVRVYGAITITKDKPILNFINADWRTKISTATGENFCKEGLVETGLEWRF